MKILFVIPYVPTLIRTRPYNFMRGLVKRGHHVDLVTLWQREDERNVLASLEQDGVSVVAEQLTHGQTMRNSLRAVLSNRPLQSDYCWCEPLARRARQMLLRTNGSGRYNVIHVEHLRGVRYGLELKSLAPTVWDSVDCISYLFEQTSRSSASPWARGMARFDLDRTRRYESWLINQFERVLVTSELDKQAFEKLTVRSNDNGMVHLETEANGFHGSMVSAKQSGNVTVLPNGVDLDYFRPTTTPRQADTLVLSGKMSYHANVTAVMHFMKEILPLIWRERPQTKLWIVGQAPPSSIKSLSADPRIVVTGYVPDVRPYLNQATVAICPLVYSTGIQNKVLEAMACATPVVCRPIGLSALNARVGEEVLAADTSHDFARQVLKLLNDHESANRIGWAGRAFVERNHRWSSVLQQLEAAYQEVIE